VLAKNNLLIPALTLVYSMIDCMAWAARPIEPDDVSGEDFVTWVDEYMLPSPRIDCTAEDLYAARFAILHSLSTESRRVRSGKARPIYYCWGTANPAVLRRFIKKSGENVVVMQLDDLLFAFSEGSRLFWEAADSDPRLGALIRPRLDQWLTAIPS
jgi:hypothetical protein